MQNLKNILFLDIETVSGFASFSLLPERLKPLWEKKAKYIVAENTPIEDSYFDKAAIYAEFAKVIVIGIGFIYEDENKQLFLKSKALAHDNEKDLLIEFKAFLDSKFKNKDQFLCAHNGKEFDFPFLCRRFLVNDIEIPKILQLRDKKPWEIPHFDTMEMWRFGDKKAYTSLELLAAVLNVPTSKSDIDGSQVNETYYKLGDLQRIAEYCKRDVATLANIYLRLNQLPIISEQNTALI